MRRRRRALWLGMLSGLFVVVPAAALAQTDTALEGKFRAGSDVVIGPEETVDDDVYAAAGTVEVDGTVNGDLIVSGGQIDVGGRVEGDLVVTGGTVRVDGRIGGDARVLAGQTRVTGAVAEDLIVGAGTLTVDDAARIDGDLAFSTGQTTLNGTVGGDVLGTTGGYEAGGQVGGAQNVAVAERRAPTALDRVWAAVRHWVSVVLVATLLLWLVPAAVRRSHDTARTQALPAAGVGLLTLVGVPVALVVALVVVILAVIVLALVALGQLAGFVLATGFVVIMAAAVVFAFAAVFVAEVIVSLLIGGLMRQPRGRRDQLVAIAVGALVLVALFAVPRVGPLVEFAVVVLGLGALVLASWRTRSEGRLQSPTTRSET
jgi:cytoskeletal protein CcmA (bactofilin family)